MMSSLLNLRMNYYFHFRTKYTEAGASQVTKILPTNKGEISNVDLIPGEDLLEVGYYAFTPDSIFKSVQPNGSELT